MSVFILCNASLNANRRFHLVAESPTLHNSYYVACPWRMPLASQKRQTPNTIREARRKKRISFEARSWLKGNLGHSDTHGASAGPPRQQRALLSVICRAFVLTWASSLLVFSSNQPKGCTQTEAWAGRVRCHPFPWAYYPNPWLMGNPPKDLSLSLCVSVYLVPG